MQSAHKACLKKQIAVTRPIGHLLPHQTINFVASIAINTPLIDGSLWRTRHGNQALRTHYPTNVAYPTYTAKSAGILAKTSDSKADVAESAERRRSAYGQHCAASDTRIQPFIVVRQKSYNFASSNGLGHVRSGYF